MSDDCIQVPRDLNENELSLCSRLHPGGKCFWRGFRLEFLVQPFEVRLPVFLVSFSTLNRSRRKEVRPFSLCSIVKCSSCSITSDNSAYVFSLGERSESMHFESLGQSYKDQAQAIGRFKVCVPLEWSGSGSVIQDLSGSWCMKGTGESMTRVDSQAPLMHHDPDRSWIADTNPDHPNGTQPNIFFVAAGRYAWYNYLTIYLPPPN